MKSEPLIFGIHENQTIKQLFEVSKNAERVSLMADGHMGYIMPIGGVAAYINKISLMGIGFDIACGNCAIKTNLNIQNFTKQDLISIANEIQNTISFGTGRTNTANDAPTEHSLFSNSAWEAIPGKGNRMALWQKAQHQLGTVGSGNHYVDVFYDDNNNIWVGVHFGSRGFGHTIASGFLALGSNLEWGEHATEQEILFDLATPIGDAYWSLMELAGQYAYAGREWVARKVLKIMNGQEIEMVHNHHNFAWKEKHFGEDYVIIRKGATPAFPNQMGFVGGSMGDDAVIIKGKESNLSQKAMYSTVHGAGRIMGRQDTKKGKAQRDGNGKIIKDAPRDISTIITRDMQNEWLKNKNVILRGGDVDEAPQAYRRLPDVLVAQRETIEIIETLHPVIVVMAGKDIKDPYKD